MHYRNIPTHNYSAILFEDIQGVTLKDSGFIFSPFSFVETEQQQCINYNMTNNIISVVL